MQYNRGLGLTSLVDQKSLICHQNQHENLILRLNMNLSIFTHRIRTHTIHKRHTTLILTQMIIPHLRDGINNL